MTNKEELRIRDYKTFGLRQEWLDEFLTDPDYFWESSSLGSAQVDGFKAWLKDAEITNAKNELTELGSFVKEIKDDEQNLVWEVIVTNLSYNSFIFNWFVNNIKVGQLFDSKDLEASIKKQGYGTSGKKTIEKPVAAFMQTCNYSPIGEILNYAVDVNGKVVQRNFYEEVTNAGLAYNLYKYGEKRSARYLQVSDFYAETCECGPAKTLGVNKATFVSRLRSLNSMNNRVLLAELNMGLDSITLREDINPLSCLKALIG